MRTPGVILIVWGLGMMLGAIMLAGAGHSSEGSAKGVENAAVRLEQLSDLEIAKLWPEYSPSSAGEKTRFIHTRLGVEWVRVVPRTIAYVCLILFGCGVVVLLLGIWVVVIAKPRKALTVTAAP